MHYIYVYPKTGSLGLQHKSWSKYSLHFYESILINPIPLDYSLEQPFLKVRNLVIDFSNDYFYIRKMRHIGFPHLYWSQCAWPTRWSLYGQLIFDPWLRVNSISSQTEGDRKGCEQDMPWTKTTSLVGNDSSMDCVDLPTTMDNMYTIGMECYSEDGWRIVL